MAWGSCKADVRGAGRHAYPKTLSAVAQLKLCVVLSGKALSGDICILVGGKDLDWSGTSYIRD